MVQPGSLLLTADVKLFCPQSGHGMILRVKDNTWTSVENGLFSVCLLCYL